MQSCNFICERSLNPVPFSPYINMYEDHVYCPVCGVYFRKPFPRLCPCCTTSVRYARRLKRQETPKYTKFHGGGRKWMEADILAAQAAGRL
jgi:hypothetical protein